MEKPDPKAVLKLVLSSLDDDQMASTDEDHVVYRPVDPHDLGQTLAPVWDTTWLVPLSEWYENFVPMETP